MHVPLGGKDATSLAYPPPSPPGSTSPTGSTAASEADLAFLPPLSGAPNLKAPLLDCEERLYGAVPRTDPSFLLARLPGRLYVGLALAAAFALGLAAGGQLGGALPALAALAGPRLRGDYSYVKQGVTPGKRMKLIVNSRSVLVYIPWSAVTGRQATPVPAVFVLHGSMDTATNIANVARFEEVAEAQNPGFLCVYPEMKHHEAMSWGFGEADERAFFRDLPHALATAGFPIDVEKVFVAGHSNGGTMSLYLQNELPDIFKGAASVEAGVGYLDKWRNASLGSPTMLVWNHNDNVLADYGGDALYRQTLLHLRRHDPSTRFGSEAGPQYWKQTAEATSGVVYANRLYWPAVGKVPPLAVVSWRSVSPTHIWANPTNVPEAFDASAQIWSFFQEVQGDEGARRKP